VSDITGMGGALDLAQGRTNFSLRKSVAGLSSGLRINGAADDPSGLAIATNLQVQSQGLDAGAQAVQTANNALTVADGALGSVTAILQRVRSLIVQGRSDLMSPADRADANSEINALMHEVNTIAQGTSFNGRKLLDGSLASSLPKPALPVIPQNEQLSSGAAFLDPSLVNVLPNGKPLNFSIKVDAYDPSTGLLTVSYNIASPDPTQTFDQPYPTTTTVAAGQNYDNFWNTFGGPIPPGVSIYQIQDAVGNPLINFSFNTITAADVGHEAFVYTSSPIPAQTGSPLNVAVGDHEGNIVSIGIDGVSTSQLGLIDTQIHNNDLNTAGAEYRVDDAIQKVVSERANIGAQVVALQETVRNADTASLNLNAAQSAIRDLNVAQATTEFTKQQILAQVQSSLRAGTNQQASSILALFK
jgi:flagellin